MTVFSEEIENEFKEMAFALEYANRGCWLFAVYNQASTRAQIIKRLQTEINLPVFTWQYSEDKPYPIDYLSDLSEEQKQQRALVSFINTVDGGEKTIKSLDFNREKFAHYPHSLIFWVTVHERGEIARKAGHFWAQRRGTFDFSKLNIIELTQSHSYGVGDWLNNLLNIESYQEALRQLELYRQLLTDYTAVEQTHPDAQRLMAETVDKISYLLYYLGRYSEAINFGQQALNHYQTLLGENDYSTIAASNNLALLYLQTGHLTETETLLEKTLSILKQRFNDTPVMATVLNNLAELYHVQGKYAAAEPLYQQSLAIREKSLGKDHPDVAGSLNNLALLYYEQGKYAVAQPLYQQSLAIREKTLGKNHPDIAIGLKNLAWLYYAQGKYAAAESLSQRSLAILEKTLGKDHPDIANSLYNLARIYYAQGKYAAAEPLYQQSLALREIALGKDHPDVANSLNDLAGIYYAQDKYIQAESLFQKSLAIREITLGKDHPDVANSLNNLAVLYDLQDKYVQAETLYQKSLAIREIALGKDHPDVANSLSNLAMFYDKQGKYAAAEPLCQRSLAILEATLGKEHPETKQVKANYEQLLAKIAAQT